MQKIIYFLTYPIVKFFKLSLASQIVVGLVLGIIAGIFFGERCTFLKVPANIFIFFIQAPVIPYVLFSLIHGIGSLNKSTAIKLAKMGGLILLLFWPLSIFYIISSQIAFPNWNSRMFFSDLKFATESLNYYNLYIPSNPFYSLSHELVPAIVVFALLVGCVLIGFKDERKKGLLNVLELLTDLMSRLTHMIVRFTPIAVFAMAANAAGTLTLGELEQMQIYIFVFIIASLLLSFFTLPLLVTTLTPFRYKDFLRISKDGMMTAFTTGNLLVILPLVASGIKQLMEEYNCYNKENQELQHTILPVYFNFPDSGKMLILIFIFFSAWYTGQQISIQEYPLFVSSGLFGMFASSAVSIPFLLNLFGIQPDMYQVYMMASIFNRNFCSLAAAVDIFVFTILCICSMTGLIKFKWKKFIFTITFIVLITLGAFFSLRIIMEKYFKPNDTVKEKLISMNIANPVDTEIYTKLPYSFKPFSWGSINLLNEVIKRGVIKVGFLPDRLPFVYRNEYLPKEGSKVLQGLEAQMMNDLAMTLKCKLEYYPLTEEKMDYALSNNLIDIAIGGIGITVDTVEHYGLTNPVLELHPAIIARFDRISEFSDYKKIKKRTDLILAYSPQIIGKSSLQCIFPKANLIEVNNPIEFYKGKVKADALIISAEQGAAFSIIYPIYSYVIRPEFSSIMLTAFAVNKNQLVWLEFLNNWLTAQKASGVIKLYYNYWIQGKDITKSKVSRWCILDDIIDNFSKNNK